jgi:TRAP-type C4-dicarboxylate transport system permease small subunit
MINTKPTGPVSPILARLSTTLAQAESFTICGFLLAIFALLMVNVTSRAAGSPLIWVDELAVFIMIWVALIGASLALAKREHLAVTLLPDFLPVRQKAILAFAIDLLLLAFFMAFALILWRWFDPLTLWRAGSISAFSRKTFNFIYQEPTVTLGIHKIWFWLILPVFCMSGLIHLGARLTAPWRNEP